jgi:hypothetical protein
MNSFFFSTNELPLRHEITASHFFIPLLVLIEFVFKAFNHSVGILSIISLLDVGVFENEKETFIKKPHISQTLK